MRSISIFVVLLACLFLFSCGGDNNGPQLGNSQFTPSVMDDQEQVGSPASGGLPTGAPVDALQPWEELSADGFTVNPLRGASALNAQSEFAAGVEYHLGNEDGITQNGDALSFTATSGVNWAYWRLLMQDAQPGAISVDVNPATAGTEYWVGLANYASGGWDWQGPYTGSHTRLSIADAMSAGADYTSELGNLFLCVVGYDGAQFDVVGVAANSLDDTDAESPDVPTGLTAEARAGALELSWAGVIAGDLAG